ncbi:TetR/AcrR family transcriptional regulator [Streptomyces zhihengii]|uniref:TetR/AcrR family transcriptional regulator C-terminal domain-containing protein n=1 Tax=Streptomyces zhihengii TaxID=1818004 RepID=A0ABS2V119_9ACTN|nr:TetR/AcrR family transcriptional regulator [Streptomyces zhihengii]MBM9623425.1 TetR/AcrR family transcriptional regulator C-terminal domain-containing protein [Streptomyces zhihengii]
MAGQKEEVIWLRPEQAPVGRPAERSRAEITAAALELADQEGLDAVSMRRLAATLGTGAASLYRYVATRDDLLDLMIDSTAREYHLPAPSGDWQADLLAIAHEARRIMRRHPWLPSLVVTRPGLGPHGVDLLEHLLDVLADHPAEPAHKLEAFAVLNALTALFVQNELAATHSGAQRRSSYLGHVAAAGTHPRIAATLAATQPETTAHDRFATVLARALSGVLG